MNIISVQILLFSFSMYFYPVYRFRSDSDGSFTRVGSIRGYERSIGSRTYGSLLLEAKKLFAIGEEDVILLGPSMINAGKKHSSTPQESFQIALDAGNLSRR